MKERIIRVIENNLLSCQNINRNLYVLRGFIKLRDKVEIPVTHYLGPHRDEDALYVFEEELGNIPEDYFDNFNIVEVIFNFFDGGVLNDEGKIVSLKPLLLKTDEVIYVFNRNNPLIGITDDLTLNNEDRLTYLQAVL